MLRALAMFSGLAALLVWTRLLILVYTSKRPDVRWYYLVFSGPLVLFRPELYLRKESADRVGLLVVIFAVFFAIAAIAVAAFDHP